jgi:hypothetical protein
MTKQNVSIRRISDLLETEDKAHFLKVFNRWSCLNKQTYESKKIVSFYDDDEDFLVSISVPFNKEDYEFDSNILIVLCYLESYCGATQVKYNGEWL